MLQQLRKIATTRIASILVFGPLIATFIIWGVPEVIQGFSDTSVMTVGSTRIPVASFARNYRNAVRNAGVTLPPDQAKALGEQVVDQLALTTALDNLVVKLGLTASDARVTELVQANPRFAPLGTFDHDTLLRVLQENGFGEQEYIDIVRKDAARGQMLRAVQGGYVMPVDYAGAIYAFINEARAAEYVTLSPSSVGDIAAPDEATLAAYVKANPGQFSTPEYRSVSIATIGADDLASTIQVSEKQVDDELQLHNATYVIPEKRDLEQIKFASEADAKAAKAALDGGQTFEALAFQRKLSGSDYQLGSVVEADLAIDPARAKAAFALPEGGTSAPVKSNFGWVLLHVTKITPGSSKSRADIKALLQRALAQDKLSDMSNAYTDALGGGASVEEAAHKAGMHYIRVAAMDEQGLAPGGAKAVPFVSPEFTPAVFKAEVGEDGDPIMTADGERVFALHVDGVTPPKIKPLDAVRAEATSRWIAEQRVAKLRARTAALTTQANAQHSLAAVAAALGAPVQSSPALNRGTNAGLFSAEIVKALFAAPPGGIVSAPTVGGDYIIARVSGIAHPVPAVGDQNFQRGALELSRDIGSDFTVTLAKAEELLEGLKINQKLVDATVGGSGS